MQEYRQGLGVGLASFAEFIAGTEDRVGGWVAVKTKKRQGADSISSLVKGEMKQQRKTWPFCLGHSLGVLAEGLSLPCGPSRGHYSFSESNRLPPTPQAQAQAQSLRPTPGSCSSLQTHTSHLLPCQGIKLWPEDTGSHREEKKSFFLFNQTASEGTWFLSEY